VKVTIYHNPRCGKSREALRILSEKEPDIEIVEYLKTPPSKEDILKILELTKVAAKDLIRTNEAEFKDNYKGKDLDEEGWIDALVKFPKLLQRPIVLTDVSGIVARPPELVNEIV